MGDSCDRILRITKSCNIAAGVTEPDGSENENYILGGVLSNSKLSWISCGPRLTTLNSDDGSKRTGWTFGWALGDPSYKVTCVEELTISASGSPILIVACESETAPSTLCFYHSGSSRVLKAIHFNDKITSLAVISRHNSPEENLSSLLKYWSGICAVGTGSGKVFLLDICWNGLQKCIEDYRQRLFDEQKQSRLLELSIQDVLDHSDCRTNNVKQGSATLSLWLNEETLQKGMSEAHPGVENILGRMPREFLSVSALKYFPQIGTLAVGYNTSCFQLWDISTLCILYTSALLEAMLPVHSFSLLEPSDDPKYVCYLWSMHHSVDEDNIPFAGMYILSFHEKNLNDYNMQTLYQGFSSCSIRYQLDLGLEIDNAVSGRIISCQSIHRSGIKSSPAWLQTSEESMIEEGSTASLLAIAWEVWTPHQLGVFTKLTVFDLHQWYREYMPQSSDDGYARFMTHFTLPDGPLLDLKVVPSSIRQFVTLQPADEHFYPSAMTFDCLCLQQCDILHCSHVGLQLECLQALQDGGPSALLLPSRLYKMCFSAGIRPLLADHGSPSAPHSKEQREYLLSVALEYEMVQYLRNCVRDWCDGSHAVAGCTLPALLQWAWGRVERYKKWLDRMREPLFDNSGAALDTNDLGIFQHVICQLHRLNDLYKLVLEKYRKCIIIGNYEHQYNAISLVKGFYDAILWCVRNNVLPETNSARNNSNHIIPYLADKIIDSTTSRREELLQLARRLKHAVPTGGLFLVDVVIAQEAGSRLTEQWEREGGQVTDGKYPPPSVQSLLRTYLVRGIPAHVKHFIVGYFLLDVLHAVGEHSVIEETRQKLVDYPSDFNLSESQCKIVQAFWQLDHQEFEGGVNMLLDGSIDKEDLQLYHHRTVICLLVASGKHKLALHYLNIRNPGLVDADDIKMNMTLLLVNDLIDEAFDLQRRHKPLRNELLEQFFTGCVEMKKIDIVFKLPLNIEEEEAFMTFLEKTSHPQADDLKVFYLLSRSRYIEAIDMNKKLGSRTVSHRGTEGLPLGYSPLGPRSRNLFGPRTDAGVPAKTVLTTRDLIINSVAKSLPSVTRELADYCSKETSFNWKRVNRPTPLSVIVHTEINKERLPFYKAADSALVQAALSKTRDTWAPLLATPAALKRKHSSTVENTPFLRTPIHSRFNLSLTKTTPNGIRSGVRWRTDDEDVNSKSVKRARLEFSPAAEKEKTKTDDFTSLKTVDMELTSAESLALLHTPYVTRTVKQKHSKETTTPHSILKGSAANTPNTPARSDKLHGSGVSRQIRFSFPLEDSPSSPSLMDEEEEQYSPAVSPRKSIHQLSSVKQRRGTPANPRLLSQALRNAVIHLQFDDEETKQVSPQIERSATATSMLEKISSSPVTSNDTFFSFGSSLSSKDTDRKSLDSRLSFKLPLGLEGNKETMDYQPDEHEYDEPTLVEDVEEEISSGSEKSGHSSSQDNIMNYFQNSQSGLKRKHTLSDIEVSKDECSDLDQTFELNSSDGTKTVVIEYSTAPKTPIAHPTVNDAGSSINEEESDDEITKKQIKWIVEQPGSLQERLKLEVHKQSRCGDKNSVASITLSEEMTMYYSEPTKEAHKIIDTERCTNEISNNVKLISDEEKATNEKALLLINTQSLPLLEEKEKLLVKETPVGCELLESEKPLLKSSICALKESRPMFSISSSSSSREFKDIDELPMRDTPPNSQADQTEMSFVNVSHTRTIEEKNLPTLSTSPKRDQNEELLSKEPLMQTKLKTTEHRLLNETPKKTKEVETMETETNNDISISAEVGPAQSKKEVSHEDIADEVSESLVVNQDFFNETNNAAETPLPHILDELLQKGRISLSRKENQETLHENDLCKDNSEESVESSLIFKQAFASPTSVALNSNQASVRWEFGASIVQEKSVEASSQDETENIKPVEENVFINQTYSSKNTNESENATLETFVSDASLVTASQLITQDVSSKSDSICVSSELISEETPPSGIPETECCVVDETAMDKENTDFTFVIESTTSMAKSFQENKDPDADFDLKLSEGDSMIEVHSTQDICTEEANEEPSYETLKPVQFQVEMDDLVSNNVEVEDLREENCDEADVYGDMIEQEEDFSHDNRSEICEEDLREENCDDDEADVYGDMIEQEEDFSHYNRSEICEEEVVCLSSSSDEGSRNESPKLHKYSSPLKRHTPKLSSSSKPVDETLDYEDLDQSDYNDEKSRDSETSDSSSKDGATESDFIESDMEANKSHSVKSYLLNSSESEEDTHSRRSWKEQRKECESSNESSDNKKLNASDDSTRDTIESPRYEQHSPKKVLSTHSELETITEESGSITAIKGDSDETSLEKPSTQLQMENINIETSTAEDKNKTGYQESSLVTDVVSLAEDKKKLFVETGSILDLKKSRIKRHSSLESLKQNSRTSRRRSSSLHDFTSMIIKETKSASSLYHVENEELNESSSMSNESTCKNCFSDDLPSEVPEETDQTTENEDNDKLTQESNNMSSKASSLCVEINSTVSTRSSSFADLSFMAKKTLDCSTRRGISLKNRFSSLQDISEEASDRNSLEKNKSIRKSISADNLMEHEHFEESHLRRSSSVSRWSDYAKAHESEMTEPDVSENESFPAVNCLVSRNYESSLSSNCDNLNHAEDRGEYTKTQKNESFSEEVVEDENWQQNQCSSTSTTKMSEVDVQPINSSNDRSFSDCLNNFDFQASNHYITRNRRAKSAEPSASEEPDKQLSKRRRSSSLLKLQNMNMILSRYSSKRKSSKKSLCEPLEIVYSDGENVDDEVSTKTQNKGVDTKSNSVDESSESVVHSESLDKSANKNTELPEQDDVTSLSEAGQSFSETRQQRGKSEPPGFTTDVIHRPSLRKSVSYQKMQNLHKLVFRRSLKKHNLIKTYETLEIIHSSDEEKSFQSNSSDSPPSNLNKEPANIKGADDEKDLASSKDIKKGKAVRKRKNMAENENKVHESVHKELTSNEQTGVDNIATKRFPRKTDHTDKKKENKQLLVSKNIKSSETVTSTDLKKPSTTNDKDTNTENNLEDCETDDRLESSVIVHEKNNRNVAKPPKKSERKPKSSRNVELPVQTDEQIPSTSDDRLQSTLKQNPAKGSKKVKKVLQDKASDELVGQKTNKKVPRKRKSSEAITEDKSEGSLNNDDDVISKKSNPVEVKKKVRKILQEQESSTEPKKKQKASKTTSEIESQTSLKEEAGSSKDIVSVKTNKGIVPKKEKRKKVVAEREASPKQEESSDPNSDQIEPTTPVSKRKKEATTKKPKVMNVLPELHQPILDSPARRTRRSVSRLSDTELLTPSKETLRRSTRNSSAMSDIVMSTPTSTAYAESEVSDASTNASFRLNTPVRRTRRQSLNTPITFGANVSDENVDDKERCVHPPLISDDNVQRIGVKPDLAPEDYLSQRRLTRNQHSQLQKSFELSLTESPRVSRLEDLPEEVGENEESVSLTPKRSSSRNSNKTLNYSLTKRTRNTPSKQ